MRLVRTKFARAAIAGVIAGTIAFGPLGTPGASAADLQSFSANSNGFALRVVIDLSGLPAQAKSQIDAAYATARSALPAEAQALVPATFPYVIDETLVKTLADATGSANKAVSILGEGFQALTSKQATSMGESQEHTEAALMIPQEATMSVLEVAAGVLKSSVAPGPKVNGEATIASVTATLKNVSDMLPTELQAAIDSLVAQVNQVTSDAETQVQSTVNTVESTVIGALPAEISSQLPQATIDDLSSAVTLPQLPDVLGTNLADASMIVNKTSSFRGADNKIVSEATSTIAAVEVLGGFLSVDAINLSSHSSVTGAAGSAVNAAGCTLANLRLGDVAGVSLDGTNLYVDVNGSPVAVPVVGETVNTLRTQVQAVLADAGLTVDTCGAPVKTASADGTSATQQVSAFAVTFAPKALADVPALGIAAGDTLMRIHIDPTVQTSAQAQLAAPVAPVRLPVTGASAFATMILGGAITAGALFLRRRMIAG